MGRGQAGRGTARRQDYLGNLATGLYVRRFRCCEVCRAALGAVLLFHTRAYCI